MEARVPAVDGVAAASAPLFELRGVTASRGGRRVLDGVSARIERGATAVAGPSGAGKSTLLRLLDRLADPDAGQVLLHGRDVRELDVLALRRRVVLVAQLPAGMHGTVSDCVSYGAALLGRRPDVPALLARVGLPEAFATREARRLSVGEQQRVSLARALALDPEVLLLDEPTAALDEGSRAPVEAALQRLVGENGVSLVLVTHDLEQAHRLASRMLWLEAGRVGRHDRADG